ncbi:MAG: hypothetical protein WCX46_04465 [Candidatus Paceibacterota bacterium]
MDNFRIKLKTKPHTRQAYTFSANVDAEIVGNNEGLFINGRKVTDIFYNGIQMRLYVLGDFTTHKKNNNAEKGMEYHFLFEENENDLKLSFDELNSKLQEAFILSL